MQAFGLEKIAQQETPVFVKELAEREKGMFADRKKEMSWVDRVFEKVKEANMAPEKGMRKVISKGKEALAKNGIPATSLHLNTDHKEKLAAVGAGAKAYIGWHMLSDLRSFASYSATNIFGQINNPWALEFHKAITQSVGTLPTGGEPRNDTGKQMLDLMMARDAMRSGMRL